MKRKYANRSDWKRIISSDYSQLYMESTEFTGFVSLLKINEVEKPFYVMNSDEEVCIANDDYYWVQHFPSNQHYCLTTMMNEDGEILQWYIDICFQVGVSNENIVWFDDLYLDIVILPSGEIIELDIDELERAFKNNEIDQSHYKLAKKEFSNLLVKIRNEDFLLPTLSIKHFYMLLEEMKN